MSFEFDPNIVIKSFSREFSGHCRDLYHEGKIAENDTGFDIDDIEAAYMCGSNHFWIAQNGGNDVVGMIGVQQHDTGVGEIRRLRVRRDHRRRGIGTRLVETAVRHCRENNFLKITLDTYIDREPAIKLFEKFHFHHSETKELHGKALLYFYLDIYGSDRPTQAPKG